MARKTLEQVIDGHKYTIGQYMGHKAMPLFFKVSRRIAPLVGVMKALAAEDGGFQSQEDILDADISELVETLLPCLMEVLGNLDDVSTMEIIKEILSVVKYNGPESGIEPASEPGPISIEIHFTGYPLLQMKLVIATLRHNYSDFLGAIPFQKLAAMTKKSKAN